MIIGNEDGVFTVPKNSAWISMELLVQTAWEGVIDDANWAVVRRCQMWHRTNCFYGCQRV